MGFYEECLEPMLRKTAKVIEETPAMQSIVNGTMTMDQLRYYYLQDYAYLLDYTRVWATALGKCDTFSEMKDMLVIINDHDLFHYSRKLPFTLFLLFSTLIFLYFQNHYI